MSHDLSESHSTATSLQSVKEAQSAIQVAIRNNKILILYFTGAFCGPCKRIKPILSSLVQKYHRQLVLYNVDISVVDLVDHFNVRAVPTFVFIRNNAIICTHQGGDAEKLTFICDLVTAAAFPDLINN
jgi:thioredoxin 1